VGSGSGSGSGSGEWEGGSGKWGVGVGVRLMVEIAFVFERGGFFWRWVFSYILRLVENRGSTGPSCSGLDIA